MLEKRRGYKGWSVWLDGKRKSADNLSSDEADARMQEIRDELSKAKTEA